MAYEETSYHAAPTAKQREFLKKYKNLTDEQLDKMTKYSASKVIDGVLNKWRKF